MEFGFRAGNRTQRRPSPDRRFTAQQAGPFHGDHPQPSPLQWEDAARRERIKREVERRLIEEEVRLELALERARLHGGFGPAPFLGTDGSVVPPPPPGRFSRADGPSMTPAMSWDDSPRRLARFEQPMLLSETGTWSLLPKPRHTLRLREIAPSESSEVLSSATKASGVKRKAAAAISATTTEQQPTGVQDPSSGQWSCAICQVSATSEANLNEHLQGKKHRAKLARCGATTKATTDPPPNRSGDGAVALAAGTSDAPKRIQILVDGEAHQVVQRSSCVWCERCRVGCTNAAAMADHLRGKRHSLSNKVWTAIKAVRRSS
ncbi:hypothetical protein Zm00014a_029123 [Zea mays]|uniref:C2H2-type domain-containing protein n=1 Tax=Zea mays TaxID=4577 RepID=A0A3L6EG58_MAIZE|nr:hypothetical protein Zm00014a_029123 [Zea mays]